MTDWPNTSRLPPLISSWSRLSAIGEARPTAAQTTVALTWVANVVVYCPVWLPWPYPVKRMFWANGSTASSNVTVGIFGPNGKRLYASASTAQSGATNIQYVSLGTTLWLAPGKYYMAFTCDGTTSRAHGIAMSTQIQSMCGVLQQAADFALADPATFAAPAQALYPLVGITRHESGF